MRTDELFPVRVYLRNEEERKLAQEILREHSPEEPQVSRSSAVGWVTPAGFGRLIQARLMVDSVSQTEPSEPAAEVEATATPGDTLAPIAIEPALSAATDDNLAADKVRETKATPTNQRRGAAVPRAWRKSSQYLDQVKGGIIGRLTSEAQAFKEKKRSLRPALTALEEDNSTPAEDAYDVTLDLPLQAAWRKQLESIAAVFSFQPPNVFRMFLSETQRLQVSQLSFVQRVDRYGLENTVTKSLLMQMGMLPGEHADDEVAAPGQICAYDMVLHRAQDADSAKQAIAKCGGQLTADSPTVLRFEAPAEPGLLAALADRPEVKCLTPYRPPTLCDDQTRDLSGIEKLNQKADGSPDPNLTGDGELVAVFDSGVDNTHPDLADRVEDQLVFKLGSKSGTKDDLVNHGTHVAGTIAGTGKASAGKIRGIAPGAKILSIGIVHNNGLSSVLLIPPDLGQLLQLAVSRGAKIINLSWGTPLGGAYDQGAAQLDRFLYDNPEVLVVIAAGNDGRAPLGVHQFNTIGTPASAKNALTVGACGSGAGIVRSYDNFSATKFPPPVGQMSMCDPAFPAALGSRGPTDYESVKPDVTACGVYVLGPKASNGAGGWKPPFGDDKYIYLGGTSMATPVISGLAAVLRQFLRLERGVSAPSAALLKSVLIAAAERTKALTAAEGGPHEHLVGYPDFHQGFGRVDLSRVLPHVAAPPGRKLLFDDVGNASNRALRSDSVTGDSKSDAREYKFTLAADSDEPLRIVLSWTDFPGNSIQNNLNLFVDCPGGDIYVGNRELLYQRDALFANTGQQGVPFDKRNNVEHILIAHPKKGAYAVHVLAQSTPWPSQGYALCVCGCIAEDVLTSTA